MVEVVGSVCFPPMSARLVVKRVQVVVRDISVMDAPAPLLGEAVLPEVELTAGHPVVVPFRLRLSIPQGRPMCAIRVHGDVNGNGTVDPGDFVSDTTTIVDVADTERRYTIQLRTAGIT